MERGFAWRESDAGSYIATGNEGALVRMWHLTEEERKPHLKLQWSSPHASLYVKGANFQNAHGLNKMQIKLLKQRGNVGEPLPPLSFRAVGEKLKTMNAAVDRLKLVPKKELLDELAEEAFGGKAELVAKWVFPDCLAEDAVDGIAELIPKKELLDDLLEETLDGVAELIPEKEFLDDISEEAVDGEAELESFWRDAEFAIEE
ncbi:hypothetical protein BGZ68_002350 [Mortierella alpina]|nr:hypothetical protein BGZ68_002350 [Mortierella alpina]